MIKRGTGQRREGREVQHRGKRAEEAQGRGKRAEEPKGQRRHRADARMHPRQRRQNRVRRLRILKGQCQEKSFQTETVGV